MVLSYYPLEPFAPKDRGLLPKAYRFLEVMARYGVNLFASGHYGVTYFGLYGGLKVASVGRVNAPCDILADKTCTPPAAIVLDFYEGRLKRGFAAALTEPPRIIEHQGFPERINKYERWNPAP